ncbi:unnamed protein product [Lymnaea stagnalis]|uniref:CABIT domain-containing protein n=1 Tax=Lymnaea stagnalis TaxID=6523 RepID=A0AAV2I2H2_LYMST
MLKWTKYGQDKKEKNTDTAINTNDDIEAVRPANHTSQSDPQFTSQSDPQFTSQSDPQFTSQIDPQFTSQIDPQFTSQIDLDGKTDKVNASPSTPSVSIHISDITNATSPDQITNVSRRSETVPASAKENSDTCNQQLTADTRKDQHFTSEADPKNCLSSTLCPSASTSLSTSQETGCLRPVKLSDFTWEEFTSSASEESTSALTPSLITDSLRHNNTGSNLNTTQSGNCLKAISQKELLEQSKMASSLPDVTTLPSAEREILGPEVAWEEEDLTLLQVADKDNFPCICSFEEHTQQKTWQVERLQPGLRIYSRQPVLMHMRVTKKQARARTIFKDPKGAYYEVGQTMIIPADYQGWFELVPSDFSRSTCFMSVADVAKAMPQKFFTRSNVKGIRTEGEGEHQKFLERKIPAGSVLETRGTFTAKWKTVAETGLLKKKTKEWEFQEVTYLKCLDRDQTEILVPLKHKGKFNAIYEKGHLTQNAVYNVKDILSDLSLPIKVRLLFGKAPVVPCIFTGMLVIRDAATDDSVVGSTVLNTRNVLFEIPLSAPVKVKYVSKDDHFKDMSTYKDAQKLCKKYANVFSTMIKLAPDLDTDQKVIMHVPTDSSLMHQVDECLRALDLITDISFAGEPKDYLLDSDAGSVASEDTLVVPPSGAVTEVTEFQSRESQTFV